MAENNQREQFAACWIDAEPSISAYVFSSISSFHDAEDVVQRIAQELARRFEEYDASRPFLGWALWIAKSRVIDFYRSRSRNKLLLSDDLLQRLSETIESQAEQRNARREALEVCMETLPTKSRKLLNLKYVEELSAEQMAAAVDSTSGSVRVLLTRIRSALANCIEQRLAVEEL